MIDNIKDVRSLLQDGLLSSRQPYDVEGMKYRDPVKDLQKKVLFCQSQIIYFYFKSHSLSSAR